MTKTTTATLTILMALAACDARTIDPGAACGDGDTDGYAATGMPDDDLMPLPEPSPEPRPPVHEEPAPSACDPDVWARVHAFAAIEYFTVLECPLVHEDLAYYQHEYDLITEQAELCGVTAEALNENDERANNTLGFICVNRYFGD